MLEPSPAGTTRREFARRVAVLAATAPLAQACAAAAPVPAPAPAPAAEPPAPAELPDAELDALVGLIRVRYGSHLTGAQLEEVRRSVRSGLRSAGRLGAAPLAGSAEPAFVFAAYRAEA